MSQNEPLSTAATLGKWAASWRMIIADRIDRLETAVKRVTGPSQEEDFAAVAMAIKQVKASARLEGQRIDLWAWIGQWMTGSSIEAAWRGLHRAETEFILIANDQWLQARLQQTQAAIRAFAGDDDEPSAATRIVLELKPSGWTPADRQTFKPALETLNDQSDNQHSDLRTVRNILFGITALLFAGLGALALAAFISPGIFSLCGAVPNCNGAPSVLEVELAGAFGGLLSTLVFLRNLPARAKPYALWFIQGLLKVPAGAAVAVVLVYLVQTGLIGALRSGVQYVIAYALVFGFAQQAATQLIDNWTASVISGTPEKGKTGKVKR